MRVALLAFVTALLAAFIAPAAGQNPVTAVSDMNTLNYALALERLEAVYYNCYLSERSSIYSECPGRNYPQFTRGNFTTAGYNSTVYDALLAIADQEAAHVVFLSTFIRQQQPSTGVAPVPACRYQLAQVLNNGTITTVAQFLTVSATLENAGVQAYAGAVNTLTNPDLVQAAVTIADVEARHSAWLYALLGTQPFPSSGFDTALTPATVVGNLGAIFFNNVTCITASGTTSDLPAVRPYGVAYSATNVSQTAYTGRLSQAAGISYSAAQRANDILVLQYALTLEQLEASFYNAAGAIFNQASFSANGLSAATYNSFVLIGLNENVHVATLRTIISSLGATPVANCTYNFGTALGNFANYTATAALLENTGVYAYTAAARMITDTNLQQAAATIAMVEARHAGFLNVITARPANDTAAFPRAFDLAIEPSAILAAVNSTGLVSNCPAQGIPVALPQNAGVPSTGPGVVTGGVSGAASTGTSSFPRGASSSTGNGASSSASFSVMMLLAAIIASLALLL